MKLLKPLSLLLAFLFFSSKCAFASTGLNIEQSSMYRFPGNWSLAPEEVYFTLKHCKYEETFRILEFGAGASTQYLVDLLRENDIPFEYHSFENDPNYIQEIEGVTFHEYFLPDVPFHATSSWVPFVRKIELPQLPSFDLVIVDGPHGISRAQWYEKFKQYTHSGSVILIDDFHHFDEFGQALDENFQYETIIEFNQSPHWKIINDGVEVAENPFIGKTFKIVKLK